MHPLLLESLGTMPPYSFKQEKTYLNISHPLQVRFAYFPNDRFRQIEIDEIPCDGREPPFVAIAKIATQLSDDGKESFVVFDQESEQRFWKKHKEYHKNRPGQLESKDDSGEAGPDDGGSHIGGVGPSTRGGGSNTSRGGPNTWDAGPSTGGIGPNTGGVGPSTRGGDLAQGGVDSTNVVFLYVRPKMLLGAGLGTDAQVLICL